MGFITPTKNIQWVIEDGIKKPYITENSKILINNLHVHSKDLQSGLSVTYV